MLILEVGFFESEDLLDGAAEDAGEQESQGQAGDVAVALNGINALAGDSDQGSEVLLGPIEPLAEFADAIVDGGVHCGKGRMESRLDIT